MKWHILGGSVVSGPHLCNFRARVSSLACSFPYSNTSTMTPSLERIARAGLSVAIPKRLNMLARVTSSKPIAQILGRAWADRPLLPCHPFDHPRSGNGSYQRGSLNCVASAMVKGFATPNGIPNPYMGMVNSILALPIHCQCL